MANEELDDFRCAGPGKQTPVMVSQNTPPSQLISPFRLVAYRLQALPSWDVPIDWASPQLTKLETLILYGEISADSPTASQLAQVLRACPGLVRLEICYEPDMTEAVPTDMSPIELPVLTVFDMEVSPAIATYILAIIRVPACENFSIVVLNPRSTFLPDALQHHTSVLASLAASSAFTDISMSEYDFRYKADEAVSIRLIAPESQSDSLIWIVNHIHPPTLSVPARLIIGTPDFPVSALALHRLACSVTKLEVYKNSDIIPYLGQLVTVEGARRFPLPNLLELSLAAFTSLEPLDVALMVEHRLGGIRSESRWAKLQSNDWPEVPVKLRKVHLPEACGLATSKAAVKRLKRFVDTLWFGRGSLEVEEQELSDDSDYGDWSDDSDYDDYNYYDYWSDGSADWFCHHDGGSEYSGDDRWAFSW
ncbi:hypothetical protein FRB97_009282 [Tulasnella sp. 331]|nr:hypothetical protein FRB97_009282 [Tulasnella sp. 331]